MHTHKDSCGKDAGQKDACTKARLLEAGRRVFSEKGPKNATVRDICDLAEANVAAVSYHFGSKERLYLAVLQDYVEREHKLHPHDAGVTEQSPPVERLRSFVRSFLLQVLGDGDPVNERLGKLLTQEFIEPSQYFGEIFERQCRPTHNMLLDILRRLLPEADELSLSRCGSSIMGQCLLFDFAREAISRMSPALELKASSIESVTDFIMEFSLGGIERLRACIAARNAG